MNNKLPTNSDSVISILIVPANNKKIDDHFTANLSNIVSVVVCSDTAHEASFVYKLNAGEAYTINKQQKQFSVYNANMDEICRGYCKIIRDVIRERVEVRQGEYTDLAATVTEDVVDPRYYEITVPRRRCCCCCGGGCE
jgi:hypothetical protein